MTLTTVLPVDQILLPLTAADRLGAIDELLASLSLDTAALDRVRAAVIAREHELTTGIGGGVAIPHARVEGIESPLLALGIAPDGLDFGAIDGAPVRLPKRFPTRRRIALAGAVISRDSVGFVECPVRNERPILYICA